MGFHEQAGNAHSHRRARQHRHELALTAAAIALSTRQLHRVRGVEHHRAAGLAHDREAAHVGHQIVVAEGGAALADHDVVGATIHFTRLEHHLFHVARRHELALLDIHRLARSSASLDEVRLPAQESRRLQHIDHGGNGSHFVFGMDVGQHRDVQLRADIGEDGHLHAEPPAVAQRLVRPPLDDALVDENEPALSEQLTAEIESWNPTPDIKLCAALYIMVSINMDTHDDELHRIFAREMAEGQGLLHEFVKEYMMPRLLIFESIIKDGISQGMFEISDTMMFSLNVVAFINDFAHGEDFLKDTAVYKTLYRDKKEKLYSFMTELSFKALKPAGKELPIPVFDNDKKERLDIIIKEMSDSLNLK